MKSYHTDDLRFGNDNFKGDCTKCGHDITFCGIEARHQNIVVESKIKEVCYGGAESSASC